MFLLRCFSYLPLGLLYAISDVLAWFAQNILRYRRKVILANLQRAFPEKTNEEHRKIMKKFYRNLSDVLVESLKAMTISEKAMRERITVSGIELMKKYYQQHSSIIALAAHQANWEWLLLGGCLYLDSSIDAVYKPLTNQRFDKLMYAIRSRFGGRPLAMKHIFREIIRRKKEVRTYALVADQSPALHEAKVWVNFMGVESPFFVGPQKIAHATGYPVVFAGMRRLRRGYYEIVFLPLAEPPYSSDGWEVIEKYAECMEKFIRENPADWLWSHRRWKHVKLTS